MEVWFRLVILSDYLEQTTRWQDGWLYDTPSAILFQRCNEEMKEMMRGVATATVRSLAPFLRGEGWGEGLSPQMR